MTDDRTSMEKQFRLTDSHCEEAQEIAETNGITPDEAKDLLERFGNFPKTLEREAKKLRDARG